MKKETTETPEATPLIQPLALRPREAAKALGLGTRKLWELTNRKIIPHIRLDSAILYSVDALREWLLAESAKGRQP